MDLAVFEKAPKLHAVEHVGVVRVGLEAELAVKSIDMLEEVQVSKDRLVGLEQEKRSLAFSHIKLDKMAGKFTCSDSRVRLLELRESRTCLMFSLR